MSCLKLKTFFLASWAALFFFYSPASLSVEPKTESDCSLTLSLTQPVTHSVLDLGVESDLNYRKFIESLFIDEALESEEVLKAPIDVTKVVLKNPRKRLVVERAAQFPYFSIRFEEKPASQQPFKIKNNTIYARRVSGKAEKIEFQVALVRAIAEALYPKWNLLRNPVRHNNEIANAHRYHARRLHALIAEAREKGYISDQPREKRENPMRKKFFRDLLFGFFPGYSYRKSQVNEDLLGIYGRGDERSLRWYFTTDEVLGRVAGGITWANRNFYLASLVLASVALADLPKGIEVGRQLAGGLIEVALRLDASELGSAEETTVIDPAPLMDLKRNVSALQSLYKDVAALHPEDPVLNINQEQYELLVLNVLWRTQLAIEAAREISNIKALEVIQQLRDEGVIEFLEEKGHEQALRESGVD